MSSAAFFARRDTCSANAGEEARDCGRGQGLRGGWYRTGNEEINGRENGLNDEGRSDLEY